MINIIRVINYYFYNIENNLLVFWTTNTNLYINIFLALEIFTVVYRYQEQVFLSRTYTKILEKKPS